jgi:hypothetical protein
MPVQILDRKEQVLRTKMIPIVKVLWRNHRIKEASWEAKRDMRNRYPHLFEDSICIVDFFWIVLDLVLIVIKLRSNRLR